MNEDSAWESVATLAEAVNSAKLTATELVEKSLQRIAAHEDFQTLIVTLADRSKQRAVEIDAAVASGKSAGKLAGVPFIAKDNFLVFGAETTAASNILKGFEAPYQSTAINRLEAEGAICVAKANLDAFGHGSSTENSDFFASKNPQDTSRVPGGSSGGSAAAIALRLTPFSLATDTGGSIRQPASFCGVVGLKPTYGLVSRNGVIAMASSTDTVGPIAATVKDVAYILDCIAGKDKYDSTTITRQDNYTRLDSSIQGKKIGIIEEYMAKGVDQEVRDAVESAIESYKKAGAIISRISLPSLHYALAAYYIVSPAEISSNLARYDGKRFGYSTSSANDLTESYEISRQEGFGSEAKRRIMIGTYVLSSGYYDAYYKKAQTVRTKLINEFNEAFCQVDFLVGPTAPTIAFKAGENAQSPLAMYLGDIMTVGASMVGSPAISVPCQSVKTLPVGLQLIARRGNDKQLLAIAQAYEELAL